MDLMTLIQNILSNVESLKEQLADANAAIAIEKKASYDEGFAAGKVSVNPGGDPEVKFTQADIDAAVAPLNEQLAALQTQVDNIPAQIDQAVVAFKADLAQKYADLQVIENQVETGFADLLK